MKDHSHTPSSYCSDFCETASFHEIGLCILQKAKQSAPWETQETLGLLHSGKHLVSLLLPVLFTFLHPHPPGTRPPLASGPTSWTWRPLSLWGNTIHCSLAVRLCSVSISFLEPGARESLIQMLPAARKCFWGVSPASGRVGLVVGA